MIAEKKCPKCGQEKAPDQFYRQSAAKDGRHAICKACTSEYKRGYHAATKEKRAAYSKAYRERNAEYLQAKRDSNVAWLKAHQRRKKYGTDGQKELADQGGKCAICGVVLQLDAKTTHIDHCHATGLVRGVLCFGCNNGLGAMKDDPARLRAAADYLESTGVFA